MSDFVLASDLGGTNTRVSAVTSDGAILASSRSRTPAKGTPEEIAGEIISLAAECCDQVGQYEKPNAFGVAVPALINAPTGAIIYSPNLPQLNGVRFTDLIAEKVDVPVVLENDANAAAAGEAWLGASKGFETSVCVTLGTGVGGGLMIGGNLWRGIDGNAGEIGHVCVVPGGVPCGCGSAGCLEQYASASAVVRMAEEIRSEFPGSVLTEHKALTSLDVFNAAAAGDAAALEVFRQVGAHLGTALAGLINVLNPEAIVVGGGAAAAWDFFIDHVRSTICEKAFQRPAERAKLVRAALGDTAGILGSARLAFDARAELT